MPPIILKRIGVGFLLIPLGFLLLFTFGEVFSGDISGLAHLVQALPLFLLAFLSCKKPFAGGIILSVIGLTLGILYLSRAPFNPVTTALVELVLFIPPFTAGLLLILSSK